MHFILTNSVADWKFNNNLAIDFETNPVFTLLIEVEDNGAGNLTDQATITLNLTDINEPPVVDPQDFSINFNAFFIFGDVNNNIHSIGNVVAFDPDAGQSITYSLIAGNGREVWEIDEFTGELLMVNRFRLNFVENFSYPLLIEVTDNSSQQLTSTAVVTIHVQIFNLIEYFDSLEGVEEETDFISSNDQNVKVYPNPSSKNITIDINHLTGDIVQLAIQSLNGEIVMRKNIPVNGEVLIENIDISDFSKGVYILRIQDGNNILHNKFIKK